MVISRKRHSRSTERARLRLQRRSGTKREIEIPQAARAPRRPYVITATGGRGLHLDRLRTRPEDFDPAVRDRLIAGAMVPLDFLAVVARAKNSGGGIRPKLLKLFGNVDAILAPATPARRR